MLNSIEDIGLLPQAIRYAKAGFSVFPIYEAIDGKCSCGTKCSSPAKHPRTKTGLLEAVTVFEQIAAWWQMWPNASIGIATGPSRLVVVDIDPRHGGDASLAALEARYGAFDTPEVLTGGGGQHFYFRTIGPVKSRANALGAEFPGIDVRAEGGYVLAPPSSHISGKPYCWEISSPRRFAPVPPWLAHLLNAQAHTPISGVDTGKIIVQGEQKTTLAKYAGRLRRLGTSPEAIADALLALNARQVVPPLPEHAVRAIAESIGRYEPHEAGILRSTLPIAVASFVVDVVDVPDTDDSDNRRYSLGIENIDRHMGPVPPGEFVIIGARQGQGKTALGETIAIQNAVHRRVIFASLEMTIEQVRDRMIGRILSKTQNEVASLRKLKDAEYRRGRDTIDSLGLVFYRPTDLKKRSSQYIMDVAAYEGADILLLDYTRSLTDWEEGNARVNSKIVQNFSMWTKEKKITLFLLSQLNRDAQGKRPIESQLQDCGRLEQEAERILLIYRPFVGKGEADNIAEIICAKSRTGPSFRGHVGWHGPTTSFHTMTKEEEWTAPCCSRKRDSDA